MALSDQALESLPERVSRQTLLINMKAVDRMSVIIIGAGSIGSNAAHICASMGIHDITVVDHDIVGNENIYPSWLYPIHLNKPKVEAIRLQLLDYGIIGASIQSTIEEFDVNRKYTVAIVATDTIESRIVAFDKLADNCSWWMDGRMGGEGCELFTLDSRDHDARIVYRNIELQPVKEGGPCGEKATAYNTKGSMVQFIGWCLRDIANGKRPPYQLVGLGGIDDFVKSQEPPKLPEE